MKISIEKGSGFCSGVTRAISMAEKVMESGQKLYCLGEIVHNEKEVRRLLDKGMEFITSDDLENLKDTNVLIRAHGEPPETYEVCERNNINIIDGTCPIVRTLQKKIRNTYLNSNREDTQIIIYGKPEHPEVIGLNGQAENKCTIIQGTDQLNNIELKDENILFSQTTMDSDGYNDLAERIKERLIKSETKKLVFNNTICKHISHRQPGIIDFARKNQLIIFVAGKNSSNGRILYEICKKENPNCKFISETDELNSKWFRGISTVGITGATSTPKWLLHQTAKEINRIV